MHKTFVWNIQNMLDAFIHFLAQHAPLIANESLTHLKTKDVCGKQMAHVNKVNLMTCHLQPATTIVQASLSNEH